MKEIRWLLIALGITTIISAYFGFTIPTLDNGHGETATIGIILILLGLLSSENTKVKVNKVIENERNSMEVKNNPKCILSFIMGIISIFIGISFSIFPLLALIFGIIGVNQFKIKKEKNKWMGIVGVVLGAIYLVASAYFHLIGEV